MADQTDIANALVSAIAAAIYPNGTGAAPTGGVQCKIFQGWPAPLQVTTDAQAGAAQVSVFPQPTERVIPVLTYDWPQQSVAAPTISMAVSGNTVTVSGSGAVNQNAALVVDGQVFVYSVQANDTATSVATALTALVAAKRTATNVGAVITIPGTHQLLARVGMTGYAFRMLRRQVKVFQVSVWAGSPAARDPLAAAVDVGLMRLERVTLPDSSMAVVRYRNSHQDDNSQKDGIYCRHLFYEVDFATTDLVSATQVTQQITNVTPVAGATSTLVQ